MGAPLLLSSMRRKANVLAQSGTHVPRSNNIRPERAEKTDGGQEHPKSRVLRHNHNNTATSQSKNTMRLCIVPDEESESMQVNLVPYSPSPDAKENVQQDAANNDRNKVTASVVYSVCDVDYSVKHNESGEFHTRAKQNNSEAVAGGGNEKTKSKVANLFSRRGATKKNTGGNKEQESDNISNNGNDGDENGDKEDNNNGNNGGDEKKDWKRISAHASFGPEHIQFAKDATLPRHLGPESTVPSGAASWTPVSGTEFKVRAGPNYDKTGKKEPSGPSLYEVYCVRYFRSEQRTVGGATRVMPLPVMGEMAISGSSDQDSQDEAKKASETVETEENAATEEVPRSSSHSELKDTMIPDVLVVHFMLPYETPNVFGQKDDGSGGECVYYLRPSQTFLNEISGRVPASPATLLFAKWCAECRTDEKMKSRFKCMALVRDVNKHSLGMLKSYNGKPVLITESGRVRQGYHGEVRYLEMVANVHHWAFMAKKGFVSLIPKFANMQMEVGFTIEARANSEMPECMLGSTVLSYVSKSTGPMITKAMQEPVHMHQ